MHFKKFFKKNRFLIIVSGLVVIFLCIFLILKIQKADTPAGGSTIEKSGFDYQSALNTIQAKSYYVYDITENKAIFSKDEHEKLPLASITKLMSGLVFMDVLPSDTTVTINESDIALDADNGLSDSFLPGEKWNLKDLLDFSLIMSSNGGIHAIASVFNNYEAPNNTDIIEMMNDKAASLGLKDTFFINETGLDVDKDMSGAYSSAYDVSMLLKNIIKNNPSLIESTSENTEDFVSESNIKHVASNTDAVMNEIPGLIASKTGYTDLAGGNLAVVFDAGIMHPVAVVVLGSTVDGRFSDVVKLTQLALQKISE
jgi:D-alanyl-D-alanine carboxypeptidase (penicillin-binding protein 5/6)